MNIYASNETNFERNGLGFLTDCIKANVIESLNGDYVLQLTYPLDTSMSEYLVEDNIIKTNVGNDNYQLFRIDRVTKDFDVIEVYALHISYDLLNNMLEDVYPQNLTCQAFGNWLLNNTQYSTNFTFQSDISSSATGRYVRRNPIDAIMGNEDNSMINLFGGEIERDNFIIKLLQSRGSNNGVKLLFGKNITQIKTIVDITSMYTRIMPIGYNGLLLPEKYVDSPIINNYPTPRITKVEFSNIAYDPTGEQEGAYTNIQDAYNALRLAANELFNQGIDKPQITIKIDWVELSKVEEYKVMYQGLERVNLGDTITAEILGFDYTTKVTKTTYNVLTDTIDRFEIGTIQKTIANSINSNTQALQQINPSSILSQAKTEATNLINNALGGYIYLDYETGNLYIMDTDNPSTAQKVWRWNLNGLGYSSTGINGTYGIAMTMNGQIVADFITTGSLNTNVINGYDSLTTQVYNNTQAIGDRSLKTSTITQEIDSIEAQIGDIADITTSASATDASIEDTELQNIANSYPIRIEIHPITDNISYLYPRNNLYPSNTLFPQVRTLRFTNTSTNDIFDYVLPQDLLYYDADNYDEFIADYEANTCQIIKKCQYNTNGSVSVLATPVTTNYSFADEIESHFALSEGNYKVELLGYTSGYLFVRLMVLNAYTAQYATKVELQSSMQQTATAITTQVSRDYETKENAYSNYSQLQQTADELSTEVASKVGDNEIISKINQTAEQIKINASKVNLQGYVTATDLAGTGSTTINGSNITTGTISANRVSGGTLQGTTLQGNTINGGSINLTQDEQHITIPFQINQTAQGYALKSHLGSGGFYFERNGVELLRMSGGLYGYGRLLINNGNGEQQILLRGDNGNIRCVSLTQTSLKKDKKNIEHFKNALNILKDIDIYKYNYKTEENSDKKHIGFVIGDKYNYSSEITAVDEEGKEVGVDLYSMTSVCLQAIKEQQKIIEQLTQRIEVLENER